MSENNKAILEKSISEQLQGIWQKLSRNQRRYVIAMQECATKKEAAELIDIMPDTVYRWPDTVDEAVRLMSDDIEAAATGILNNALAKAAAIKAAGLDSDDERTRQAAATEILDRKLGKPTQRSEVTGADGGDIRIVVEYADDTD